MLLSIEYLIYQVTEKTEYAFVDNFNYIFIFKVNMRRISAYFAHIIGLFCIVKKKEKKKKAQPKSEPRNSQFF